MIKTSVDDLAILGGQPVFSETLHVGRPNIGKREQLFARLNDMLDRRWLSNNGPYVQELEQRLAEFLGVKHCIALCNATIGLEIAARAAGLTGEVIIPSFTFVATAHSLMWQGITPIFCDVDPLTHNLNPAKVESLITPRTTGILGVHVWGRACDIDELNLIAEKHNIKLLFDAAHALGSTYRGKMIGNFGEAEVFSFHATKFFNSFEGGAVTTNKDEVAQRVRRMVNFGFAGMDRVVSLGINGKMSEVSAAMGLTSFESMAEFIGTNKHNYDAYSKSLDGVPGLKLVTYDDDEKNNYQYIVIEVNEQAAGIDRDSIFRLLHAENVRARRYFYPGCHQMEPYRSDFPDAGKVLPETEKLTLQVLQLPTGTAVGEREIDQICDLIRFIILHGQEIRARMEKHIERKVLE